MKDRVSIRRKTHNNSRPIKSIATARVLKVHLRVSTKTRVRITAYVTAFDMGGIISSINVLIQQLSLGRRV